MGKQPINPVTEAFIVQEVAAPKDLAPGATEKDTLLTDVYSAVFNGDEPSTKARINDQQLNAYANALAYGQTFKNDFISKWIETRLRLSISLGGKSRAEATSIISALMIPFSGTVQDEKPTMKKRLLDGFTR